MSSSSEAHTRDIIAFVRATCPAAHIAVLHPTVDAAAQTIRADAAPLTGLGIVGYRDLERRAGAATADWQVMLAPPGDIALPDIAIRAGVIDDAALEAAAGFRRGWRGCSMSMAARCGNASSSLRA